MPTIFQPRPDNRHTGNTHVAGFSLIELLVALVIVGILASVAYPIYLKQVRAGRRTEAQAVMAAAALYLQRLYSAQGSFNDADLSKVNLATVPTSARVANATYTLVLEIDSAGQTYTITATPVLGDPDCGNLSLAETGAKSVSKTGASLSSCWR